MHFSNIVLRALKVDISYKCVTINVNRYIFTNYRQKDMQGENYGRNKVFRSQKS